MVGGKCKSSRKLVKNIMKLKTKLKKIKKLADKALKDKPEWKPSKDYKYLEDIPIGSLFMTESGLKGILLDCEINAKVLITDVPEIYDKSLSFSLGKTIISSKTEVKEIK